MYINAAPTRLLLPSDVKTFLGKTQNVQCVVTETNRNNNANWLEQFSYIIVLVKVVRHLQIKVTFDEFF